MDEMQSMLRPLLEGQHMINAKLDALTERVGGLESRMDKLENRMDRLEASVGAFRREFNDFIEETCRNFNSFSRTVRAFETDLKVTMDRVNY